MLKNRQMHIYFMIKSEKKSHSSEVVFYVRDQQGKLTIKFGIQQKLHKILPSSSSEFCWFLSVCGFFSFSLFWCNRNRNIEQSTKIKNHTNNTKNTKYKKTNQKPRTLYVYVCWFYFFFCVFLCVNISWYWIRFKQWT